MAALGEIINDTLYIYTGGQPENIPRNREIFVIVDNSVTVIRRMLFAYHSNIIGVFCHENVQNIEERAFHCCTSIKRLIIPGVKVVGWSAFSGCHALKVDMSKKQHINHSSSQER